MLTTPSPGCTAAASASAGYRSPLEADLRAGRRGDVHGLADVVEREVEAEVDAGQTRQHLRQLRLVLRGEADVEVQRADRVVVAVRDQLHARRSNEGAE